MPEAACKGEDGSLWFGEHVCDVYCDGPLGCMAGKSEQGRFNRIKQAKAICFSCPERMKCLKWALDTGQEFGVWGGCTERERNKLRKERRG